MVGDVGLVPKFFETIFPRREGRVVLEFKEDVEVLLDEFGEAFHNVLVNAGEEGLTLLFWAFPRERLLRLWYLIVCAYLN